MDKLKAVKDWVMALDKKKKIVLAVIIVSIIIALVV